MTFAVKGDFEKYVETQSGVLPACKQQENIIWDKCEPWERDWDKSPVKELPAGAFVADDGTFWVTLAPDWPTRIRAAEWIFLPPFGLLLLGFMVVWAIRGFRR